jgi:hypothetical protein
VARVIEILKRLLLSPNYMWEVLKFQPNVFKVKFPTKDKVQRMKSTKQYQILDIPIYLKFDEWGVVDEPMFMLPVVSVEIGECQKM